MGAMSASIKGKGCRQNQEDGSSNIRIESALKESDNYDSYHSHHRLIGAKLNTRPTQQLNKERKTSSRDSSVKLHADEPLFKSVGFSSKTQFESTHRRQPSACRSKPSSPQEQKSGKRRPQCSSKLVQTSSSACKAVSRRSIAVGASNVDVYNTNTLEKYQLRPASKSQRRPSSKATRRSLPPGSSMTISSGPYSGTESSIMAALEAPPASCRHSRCMEDRTFANSPAKKMSSVHKKTKRNPAPAQGKVKRKRASSKIKTS